VLLHEIINDLRNGVDSQEALYVKAPVFGYNKSHAGNRDQERQHGTVFESVHNWWNDRQILKGIDHSLMLRPLQRSQWLERLDSTWYIFASNDEMLGPTWMKFTADYDDIECK